MFLKTYKLIRVIMIMVVLLGHHSLQAHAIETASHDSHGISCAGHDCHSKAEMEICEKIQGDEMQVVTEFVLFHEISHCIFTPSTETLIPPDEVYQKYRERIPISQKQLARAHL